MASAPAVEAPPPPAAARYGVEPAWALRAAAAVLVRPALWATAVRQLARLAPRGWWRRPPHLPLPDPTYLRFRLVTAYGGGGSAPRAEDVVTYLHWCRSWPHVTDAGS